MKKNLQSALLLLILLTGACLSLSAQCPTISIFGSATPSVICSGTSSQLSASAQMQGGGYSVVQIPFAPVAGSGDSVALGDDQLSGLFPIGFNFIFFGTIHNQFNICSNGFISFNANNSPLYNPSSIPNAASPNNFIAGAWEDLNPGSGGTIEYFNVGISPNRKLIVNFIDVPHYPQGNPMTMQFILYETTNEIDIHITTNQGAINGTEGIENAGGTLGVPVPGRNDTIWAATNDAWRFTPGDTVLTYSWSPAAGLSNPNIFNPVANPVVSTQYTVTATDTNGCTGTDTVEILVVNPLVSVTAIPDTICAGDNSQLNAAAFISSTNNYTVTPIPFAPVAGAGTYVNLDDDQVSPMKPIGFIFGFYGNYYSQFNISSNGFITFDNAASVSNYQGCCAGQMLPNSSHPYNLIAAAWEDLNPSAGGVIKYFNTGAFPFQTLVVKFTNVPHAPARDSVSFEIILYETTNVIEIHTTSMPGNPNGYWYAHTMGIENAGGTNALTVPGRNSNNTWTAANEAWRFAPAGLLTYTWTPSNSLSNAAIYNPVATPAVTTTYSLIASDSSGCTGNASITVTVNPLPAPPVITPIGNQLQSNYATGNQWYLNGVIIPGAVFQNYMPVQTGTYTVIVTDANGCSASSAPHIVTTIGINEIKTNEYFTIYPNPVIEKFLSINTAANGTFEFILYDITSRKLMNRTFSNSVTIDMVPLAKGIYVFEIKNPDNYRGGVVKKGMLEKD